MNNKLPLVVLLTIAALAVGFFSSNLLNRSEEPSSTGSGQTASQSEEVKSPFGGHVHALAINHEGSIFLGARPIYKSDDGGKSWIKVAVPKSQERANTTAIVIDPKNPQIMYATGHGLAVVKSIDGGLTWERKNKGLGGDSTEAIAIDANDSNKLYVWVLGDGVYRSENAGESWARVDDGPKDREVRALASVNIPTGMGGIWLYVALDDGVKKSPDCFCGWDKISNAGLPEGKRVYSLAVDPSIPKILYAGLRDGVYKSENAGEDWGKLLGDVTDAVVAVHPQNASIIYASSDVGQMLVSADAGKTWKQIRVTSIK